jgi:hypothetical protein
MHHPFFTPLEMRAMPSIAYSLHSQWISWQTYLQSDNIDSTSLLGARYCVQNTLQFLNHVDNN